MIRVVVFAYTSLNLGYALLLTHPCMSVRQYLSCAGFDPDNISILCQQKHPYVCCYTKRNFWIRLSTFISKFVIWIIKFLTHCPWNYAYLLGTLCKLKEFKVYFILSRIMGKKMLKNTWCTLFMAYDFDLLHCNQIWNALGPFSVTSLLPFIEINCPALLTTIKDGIPLISYFCTNWLKIKCWF